MNRTQATHDIKARKQREFMELVRRVQPECRDEELAAAKSALRQSLQAK